MALPEVTARCRAASIAYCSTYIQISSIQPTKHDIKLCRRAPTRCSSSKSSWRSWRLGAG